jgi:uracil-DNA glycosylase family 4
MSPPRADAAAASVRGLAQGCADHLALTALASRCEACEVLAAARGTVVVGEFPIAARLLLVGEAPGAAEDETGRPFVGRAGQLLDRLLTDAGIDRHSAAVANVVKCRPPDNRTPTRGEVARCRGWLERQIELAGPELVVTLGGTALAWALGYGVRLRDVRGRVHDWNGLRLLPTYHPSAALRFGPNGEPMRMLRADLELAAEALCTN